MSDVLTYRHAGAVNDQHSTKTGFRAWGVSLVALGLIAGGVIAGPQLLTSPAAPAAPPAPPSVAVSVPVQRDVAGRLEFLGQLICHDLEGAFRLRLVERQTKLVKAVPPQNLG